MRERVRRTLAGCPLAPSLLQHRCASGQPLSPQLLSELARARGLTLLGCVDQYGSIELGHGGDRVFSGRDKLVLLTQHSSIPLTYS